MMKVRLPVLLDSNLAEAARLSPTAGSLTQKMKGASEAALTLAEDAPAVQMHSWIGMYTRRGFAGIFRVTNAARNYKKQIDLTLLHGIDILSDSVWEEQTEFEGTKAEYLAEILNQQTQLVNGVKPWVLGTCDDTSTVKRTINYDRLSTLLEEQEEDGGAYYFTYDQTAFPWTLNYVLKPAGVASEFRLGRNVQTASVTYNDADLCTRLILSDNHKVQDEGTSVTSTDMAIKTYNNTAAQAVYGIVVKTADIDTGDDVAHDDFTEADAWAAAFLAKRAEPSVQIQIDGEELSWMTGDSWDEYSVGKLCRVAIPEYAQTFEERVVSVTYPDLLKTPDKVTVSLANTLPRFSESIASAQNTANAAHHTAHAAMREKADAKEMTVWSQTVKYYGEALDGTGVLTLYETGIDMDATGGVTIYSLVEGVQALYGGIQVNANAIELVVTSSTDPTTGDITHSVNTASIILAINGGTGHSEVSIEADIITLNGQSIVVTGETAAQALTATEMQCDYFYMMNAGAEMGIDCDAYFYRDVYLANDGGTVIVGDGDGNGEITGPLASFGTVRFEAEQNNYDLTATNVAGMIESVETVSNGLVLRLNRFDGTHLDFSKATSLSGLWSGSTLTITAAPQGNTYTVDVDGVDITEPVYPYEQNIGSVTVKGYDGTSYVTQYFDMYLNKGSWVNGHCPVDINYGSQSGDLISRVWVDSSYSFGPANSTNTPGSYNRNYSLSSAFRYHYITANICGEYYTLQIQIT